MGSPKSAAARNVSPANTPSPPLYVGRAVSRPISIEKYAIVSVVLNICTWNEGARSLDCLQRLPFDVGDDSAGSGTMWQNDTAARTHLAISVRQGKCQIEPNGVHVS